MSSLPESPSCRGLTGIWPFEQTDDVVLPIPAVRKDLKHRVEHGINLNPDWSLVQ